MKTIDKIFGLILIIVGILFWYFMLYKDGYPFDNTVILIFTFTCLTVLFFLEKMSIRYVKFYLSIVAMFFAAIYEGLIERVKNFKIK